jgi:hypothetical protein
VDLVAALTRSPDARPASSVGARSLLLQRQWLRIHVAESPG